MVKYLVFTKWCNGENQVGADLEVSVPPSVHPLVSGHSQEHHLGGGVAGGLGGGGGEVAGVTKIISDFPFIRTRHCRLSNGDDRVKMSGAKIVCIESLNICISKSNH